MGARPSSRARRCFRFSPSHGACTRGTHSLLQCWSALDSCSGLVLACIHACEMVHISKCKRVLSMLGAYGHQQRDVGSRHDHVTPNAHPLQALQHAWKRATRMSRYRSIVQGRGVSKFDPNFHPCRDELAMMSCEKGQATADQGPMAAVPTCTTTASARSTSSASCSSLPSMYTCTHQ